jgi:hypothetical protein
VVPGLVAAQSPSAEEPLVANRPGFSSVSEVVPKGDVELNAGIGWSRAGEEEGLALGQVFLRAGVGGGFELRLGLNSWVETNAAAGDLSGVEDAFIGLKYGLREGGGRWPEAALIVESTVPSGDDSLGVDDPQPRAILVLSWDLTARVHLDSNYGIASRVSGPDRYEEALASFAFGISLVGDLAAYLEYAGFVPLEGGRDESHYAFAALTWVPSPARQLDIGIGQGFNGDDPDLFASLGMTYRW